jgi:type I restriction enzyme S subunit
MILTQHAETKPAIAPWIDVIPTHWDEKPFYAVARERKVKNKGMKEDNLLSLSYGNIVRKDINTPTGLLPDSFETYQIVEAYDVIFRLTDLQNDKRSLRSAICSERGIITSAYLAAQTEGFQPAFMSYLMRSYDKQKVFYSMGGGMRQSLGYEDIRRMPVVVPPIEEQTAIANFLDRETTQIDGLIEKKGRFIALLKEKRASVITHAVTKGFDRNVEMKPSGEAWIGDIPAHWEVKPLRTFFKYRNEKNDPVKTENILSLSIAHGVTPYSEEGRGGNKSKDDLTAYKIAHEGDIVLNSMNVIVGAVGRSKYHGAISPVYYALYPADDGVYVPFFEKVFMNTGFQKGLLRFGKGILMKISGTGQMNTIRMKISQDDLKTVAFPVPPHEEQVEIARHIEFEVSRIDGLIAKTTHSIDLLNEKRSALITAAVTGKIDVRDAA